MSNALIRPLALYAAKKSSCVDNLPRISGCNVKLRRTSGRSIERALTGTPLGQAKKAAHPLQG